MRLIIGLGNPEKQYQYTRHNFGFLVVDEIAGRLKLAFKKDAAVSGRIAQGMVDGTKVWLLQPLTFMNHSGLAVRSMIAHKSIALEDVLVVCDDLDLAFGSLRLRAAGSAGGHNGLKSIIDHVKTQQFARLRCGIGRPQRQDPVEYVLAEFSSQEKKHLADAVNLAADCCMSWLTQGVTKTMSQFNKRIENE